MPFELIIAFAQVFVTGHSREIELELFVFMFTSYKIHNIMQVL